MSANLAIQRYMTWVWRDDMVRHYHPVEEPIGVWVVFEAYKANVRHIGNVISFPIIDYSYRISRSHIRAQLNCRDVFSGESSKLTLGV